MIGFGANSAEHLSGAGGGNRVVPFPDDGAWRIWDAVSTRGEPRPSNKPSLVLKIFFSNYCEAQTKDSRGASTSPKGDSAPHAIAAPKGLGGERRGICFVAAADTRKIARTTGEWRCNSSLLRWEEQRAWVVRGRLRQRMGASGGVQQQQQRRESVRSRPPPGGGATLRCALREPIAAPEDWSRVVTQGHTALPVAPPLPQFHVQGPALLLRSVATAEAGPPQKPKLAMQLSCS